MFWMIIVVILNSNSDYDVKYNVVRTEMECIDKVQTLKPITEYAFCVPLLNKSS